MRDLWRSAPPVHNFPSVADWADALPKLVGVGIQVPEGWSREKLGIPEAKPGEAVLGIKAAAPPALADPNAPIDYPTFADGLWGMQCLEKALESSTTGRWVSLP